ncbi:MAG: agmatinase [Kiritimatiellae bacterium]|nr:agmatinase [Kiritimatiellia bacterium]
MTTGLPPFLGSEHPPVAPNEARFHVIPAPMELSVSYGSGAANGPEAILRASDQLEAYEAGSFPCEGGIFTASPTLPQESERANPEAWLAEIENAVGFALDSGAKPVLLGGEHTVTLGALRAYHRRKRDIGIVHFDAHADLRDTYEGTPFSHACVLRRCHELGFPLVQFATRAYCQEEAVYRKANPKTIFAMDAEQLALKGPPSPILPKSFPKQIYVTFDVDGLDPAIMPSTGTPVPGGLMWYSALFMLREIAATHDIAGCDVTELAPIPQLHHADFTAAKLVQRLMGLM